MTLNLIHDTERVGRKTKRGEKLLKYIDEHTVKICGGTINPHADNCVDDEFIRKIRASYYLLGAMLGKYKRSSVALKRFVSPFVRITSAMFGGVTSTESST